MNGPRDTTRLLAGLAILALATPAPALAQEGGPLLKSDLVRMMTASNYTPTEMAAIVRMNCVGFEPTTRDRRQLGNLPNADVVLAEVDRCMTRPRSAGNGGAAATKATASEPDVERAPPRPRRRNIDLGNLDITSSLSVAPQLERPGGSDGPAKLAPPTVEQRTTAETPPELTNWKQVSAEFLRAYRPNVRQPGTVLLWLRVGPDGRVAESRVKRATGDPAMAEAALQVTDVMVFKPAIMRDRPVESWTELPINFSSK
jgi:TonB family protein